MDAGVLVKGIRSQVDVAYETAKGTTDIRTERGISYPQPLALAPMAAEQTAPKTP